MPVKLVNLKRHGDQQFKRLAKMIERLSSNEGEQARIILSISDWTNKGIDVPTALEGANGWYKNFDVFAVVGSGGSALIDDIVPTHGNKYTIPGKINLDAWVPSIPKKKGSSLDENLDRWLDTMGSLLDRNEK